MKRIFLAAAFAAAIGSSQVHADFEINLNPSAGMSQQSQDAFRVAADYWESQLTDDVQVNIDIDFRALGSGILGQASSTRSTVSVANYFTSLSGDATSADDIAAVASLPTLNGTGALSFRTQRNTEGGSSAVSLDNDGSANNRFLSVNTANLKAVGLRDANDSATDAAIAFSSSFNWDFDQSDGISAGQQDFVGVAVHEIGHALGFVSGVDTVDFAIGRFDVDDSAVFSGWDMFRYSADDGILDLSVGTDSYFSLDGGATNLGLYSTGSFNGDGRQASHWKDNLGLGIMDPTAAPPGNLNVVTDLDLMAFDVMGWDLASAAVPEPSSGFVLGSMVALLACRRKRTK